MSADADVAPALCEAQAKRCRCGASLPGRRRTCDACQKEDQRRRDRKKEERRKASVPSERRLPPRGSPTRPRVRSYEDRLAEYKRRRERNEGRKDAYLQALAMDRKRKAAERKAQAQERATAKAEADRRRLIERPWTDRSLTGRERYAMRYHLDPEFNLRERIRSQVRDRRKTRRFEEGLRRALCNSTSGRILEGVLGYSMRQLRESFERQFTKGMTWDRFTSGEIHIGHIVPLHRFDLNDTQDAIAAWAITNLRPEWAEDNLKRGRAYDLLV